MPDLEPTLTDSQVLEFCKRGYMMLEGVVTEEVNRQVREYLADHPYEREDGGAFEDQGLLQEPWFVDGVLLNRQAAGGRRQAAGGRRRALAAGRATRAAHLDVQPPGALTAPRANLAS